MKFLFVLPVFVLTLGCSPQGDRVSESLISDSIEETFDPNDYDQIFRRTTLVVRDIEKSLALYKDAIGMEIIYDNILERPHPSGEGTQQLRLVFLKSVNQFYGVLGLLEYQYGETDKEIKPIVRDGFSQGSTVLLFNTNDQEAGYARIVELPDIEVYSEPKVREYPSYDGKDLIRVKVSVFYDPDGFIVEYNQVLEGL